MRVYLLLFKIHIELQNLDKRMERIEALLEGRLRTDFTVKENELLGLNDRLRRTYLAVLKLGQASAQEIAYVTGRTRADESLILNQLVFMRKLQRRQNGRFVIFYKDSFVDIEEKNLCALTLKEGERMR